MKRKQLISIAVGLFSLLAMAAQANAHAFMVRAEPRVGSKVKKAPIEVRTWFSEPVRSGLSSIKVFALCLPPARSGAQQLQSSLAYHFCRDGCY